MISFRQDAISGRKDGARRLRQPALSLVLWCATAACAEQPPVYLIDMSLNPWLGKSKEERIRIAGAPTQCTNLNTGEEVCDWVRRGPYDISIDCPADGVYGGHRCQRRDGQGKHHLIFRYDRKGIAHGWTYWGSGGRRSSETGETQESMLKQARIATP